MLFWEEVGQRLDVPVRGLLLPLVRANPLVLMRASETKTRILPSKTAQGPFVPTNPLQNIFVLVKPCTFRSSDPKVRYHESHDIISWLMGTMEKNSSCPFLLSFLHLLYWIDRWSIEKWSNSGREWGTEWHCYGHGLLFIFLYLLMNPNYSVKNKSRSLITCMSNSE